MRTKLTGGGYKSGSELMRFTWRSQEVSISNNYVAVAWNYLGSGRPLVLGLGHLPRDHVNLVGCNFILLGDYNGVNSEAHY